MRLAGPAVVELVDVEQDAAGGIEPGLGHPDRLLEHPAMPALPDRPGEPLLATVGELDDHGLRDLRGVALGAHHAAERERPGVAVPGVERRAAVGDLAVD